MEAKPPRRTAKVQGFGPPKGKDAAGLKTMSTTTGSTMMKDEDLFAGFPKRDPAPKKPVLEKAKTEDISKDIFSFSSKKKKNSGKGNFMSRFMAKIAKDEKMYKGQKKVSASKKLNEDRISKKIEQTFNREEKLNEYEKIEEEVVGQKKFTENLEVELEAQNAELERLFECPEGCGRSFRKQVLQKHIKVCKKVFRKDILRFEGKGEVS